MAQNKIQLQIMKWVAIVIIIIAIIASLVFVFFLIKQIIQRTKNKKNEDKLQEEPSDTYKKQREKIIRKHEESTKKNEKKLQKEKDQQSKQKEEEEDLEINSVKKNSILDHAINDLKNNIDEQFIPEELGKSVKNIEQRTINTLYSSEEYAKSKLQYEHENYKKTQNTIDKLKNKKNPTKDDIEMIAIEQSSLKKIESRISDANDTINKYKQEYLKKHDVELFFDTDEIKRINDFLDPETQYISNYSDNAQDQNFLSNKNSIDLLANTLENAFDPKKEKINSSFIVLLNTQKKPINSGNHQYNGNLIKALDDYKNRLKNLKNWNGQNEKNEDITYNEEIVRTIDSIINNIDAITAINDFQDIGSIPNSPDKQKILLKNKDAINNIETYKFDLFKYKISEINDEIKKLDKYFVEIENAEKNLSILKKEENNIQRDIRKTKDNNPNLQHLINKLDDVQGKITQETKKINSIPEANKNLNKNLKKSFVENIKSPWFDIPNTQGFHYISIKIKTGKKKNVEIEISDSLGGEGKSEYIDFFLNDIYNPAITKSGINPNEKIKIRTLEKNPDPSTIEIEGEEILVEKEVNKINLSFNKNAATQNNEHSCAIFGTYNNKNHILKNFGIGNNPDKQTYDDFKKELHFVSAIVYHASIIYEYFKKYSINLLSDENKALFNEKGFQKESLYIAQNICKELLLRLEKKNLTYDNYENEIKEELKIFDGLFFKRLNEHFQSRLELIKNDLIISAEFEKNEEKTDEEYIQETLEKNFYDKNIDIDLESEVLRLHNEKSTNNMYFRSVPNPYIENSEYRDKPYYRNNPQYNENLELQQKIIKKDEKIKQSKESYQEQFEQFKKMTDEERKIVVTQKKEQKKTLKPTKDPGIKDITEFNANAINIKDIDQYTEDLLTNQKNQAEKRLKKLEEIKASKDKKEKKERILNHRQRYIHRMQIDKKSTKTNDNKVEIKLDFSKEYLKELEISYTKYAAEIRKILKTDNVHEYKKFIINLYKKENNAKGITNKSNDKEVCIHYINSEKEKHKDDKGIIKELDAMINKLQKKQNIDNDLSDYNLHMYLNKQIADAKDTMEYLEIKIDDFKTPKTKDLKQHKQNLINEIENLQKSDVYKNKIEKLNRWTHKNLSLTDINKINAKNMQTNASISSD